MPAGFFFSYTVEPRREEKREEKGRGKGGDGKATSNSVGGSFAKMRSLVMCTPRW